MKFFRNLRNKPLEKNLQEKNDRAEDALSMSELGFFLNRNQAALRALSELGFSMPAIRKALLDLNQIKLKQVINNYHISVATLCRTIKGFRGNKTAQIAIVDALGLAVHELFPEDSDNADKKL